MELPKIRDPVEAGDQTSCVARSRDSTTKTSLEPQLRGATSRRENKITLLTLKAYIEIEKTLPL